MVVLLFPAYSVQAYVLIVDPDDRLPVQAADHSAAALSDDFIIPRLDVPEGFFHLEQSPKAGHVQNVIDLGRHIDDVDLRLLLAEFQKRAEPRTRDILQSFRIQRRKTFRMLLPDPDKFCGDLLCIIRIDLHSKKDRQSVFRCTEVHSIPPSEKAYHRPVRTSMRAFPNAGLLFVSGCPRSPAAYHALRACPRQPAPSVSPAFRNCSRGRSKCRRGEENVPRLQCISDPGA